MSKNNKAFVKKIMNLGYASTDNPFAGRVICGCCGSIFGRKVWNSTDERHRRIIWRCNKKYEIKGKKSCDNKHIEDKVLYKVFERFHKIKKFHLNLYYKVIEKIVVYHRNRTIVELLDGSEIEVIIE